jgi:murein DD-endopeptidase MepM/ murein hydrolase activator NlpD
MLLKTTLRTAQRFSSSLQGHSRAMSVAFVAVLSGFAVAAFGVAPLLPDPAELPQRVVLETITPAGLNGQLDALAEQELELSRSALTQSGDTVGSLLRRLGVNDAGAAEFLSIDPQARRLLEGRGGKMVQARVRTNGTLVELVARSAAADDVQRQPRFARQTISQVDGLWRSLVELRPLVAQTRLSSGTIRSSLFAATDEARIPDAVAVQVAEIFATDIDFHRELRKGDTFSVVYEALVADGEPVAWGASSGRVLSAEFVNAGKVHQAMWFADATSGKGAYFGFNGESKNRAFLASPLEFSRVTSGFAMRFHPLLQTMRRHLGVDYGAPSGTPVRSVGEGTIEFAGWQNGYGNVVEVRHANERSTLYAHLSQIDVRKGQGVEQGQRLGTVGATGWATGPHLHFEFRVNGQHQDPLTVAKASETLSIDSTMRPRFNEQARSIKAQLELAQTMVGARQAIE